MSNLIELRREHAAVLRRLLELMDEIELAERIELRRLLDKYDSPTLRLMLDEPSRLQEKTQCAS